MAWGLFAGSAVSADAGQEIPVHSYKDGLQMLARELPFDPAKAVYGRFTPADQRVLRVFLYSNPRLEDLSGNGWLTEIDGRTVFWLRSGDPFFVSMDKRGSTGSNIIAGEFEPQDLEQDHLRMEKEIREKPSREASLAAETLMFTAVILDAQGLSRRAELLADLALYASRDRAGGAAQSLSAELINSMAMSRYKLAMNREEFLDLPKLQKELVDILTRYEGCYYYAPAVQKLERAIANTLESEHSSPFLTWRYSEADLELLERASRSFWILERPEQLAPHNQSPIAALLRKGVEALPELQAMLRDERLVALVDRKNGFDTTPTDLRSITNALSVEQVHLIYQRLEPRPYRMMDIAQKMLSGIVGGSPYPSYANLPEDESMEVKAAQFHAKYQGLSGSQLAEAIVNSSDLATKERMLGEMEAGDPNVLAPILQKYVEKEKPSRTMLQFVFAFTKHPPELSGPVVKAFLARAPDLQALADEVRLSPIKIAGRTGQGFALPGRVSTGDATMQIHRLKLVSKPISSDDVAEYLITNPQDTEFALWALNWMEPEALAESLVVRMTKPASPSQIRGLLGGIGRAATQEDNSLAAKQEEFKKALLSQRTAWEEVFSDRRRMPWGPRVGDCALTLLYALISEKEDQTDINFLLGGEALVRFLRNAVTEYWNKQTPLPKVPRAADLSQADLEKLKAEALAAPDLRQWLREVPLAKGLALPIAAIGNEELTRRLRPIVSCVGEVVIDASPGVTAEKARALEGKPLSVDKLMELMEASLEENLDILVTRTEVPGPLTIILTKPGRYPRMFYIGTFESARRAHRSEDTSWVRGLDEKEQLRNLNSKMRRLLEKQLGSGTKNVGRLVIGFGSDVIE